MKKLLIVSVLFVVGCHQQQTNSEQVWIKPTKPNDAVFKLVVDSSECEDDYETHSEFQPIEFPRRVVIDNHMSEMNIDSTYAAAYWWDELFHRSIFVPEVLEQDESEDCSSVYISEVSSFEKKGVLGYTTWNSCRALVTVLKDQSEITVAHELGHSLNLIHVDDSKNIMFHATIGVDISDHQRCLIDHALSTVVP